MITLVSLLDICENKRVYNKEYHGYYLGHDDKRVFFGYIHPLMRSLLYTKTDNTLFHLYSAFGTAFSYSAALSFIKGNEYNHRIFRIPTLEEIEIITNSLVNYETRLECWININDDLQIYDGDKKTVLTGFIPTYKAAILLIRSIELQQ